MSWSLTWVFLGLAMWIFGFTRVGYVGERRSPLYQAFTRPPLIVYIVCGMSKARSIPRGIMSISSLMGQLVGLLWIAYGLIFSYLPNKNIIIHGIFLLAGSILINIFCWNYYQSNPFKKVE